MAWYIYQFIHKDNGEEHYSVLKNKNINEVRYNIKSNRTKVSFINDGSEIGDYNIKMFQELNDVKSKNEALLQLNSIIKDIDKNKINKSNENINQKYTLNNIFKLIDDLEIGDTTKTSYKNLISTIFKIYYGTIQGGNTFDIILNDFDIFIEKLQEQYVNVSTQREIIVKFLRIAKLLDFDKNIIEKLTKIMYEFQDKHLDVQDEKRLEEITITRDDLIKKTKELYDDEKISLMIYLILNIHIYYPKRDDYKNIKIIYDNTFDNIYNEIKDDDENIKKIKKDYDDYDGIYLKNVYTFIIYKYKNVKSYGLDIFTIEDNNMKKIIDETFDSEKYTQRDLFYHNEKGNAYKSVSNIFRKYLDISLNDIRKMLTKEQGTFEAKKQLKHSSAMSRAYYKRK